MDSGRTLRLRVIGTQVVYGRRLGSAEVSCLTEKMLVRREGTSGNYATSRIATSALPN